jgi:hypothetical protein
MKLEEYETTIIKIPRKRSIQTGNALNNDIFKFSHEQA